MQVEIPQYGVFTVSTLGLYSNCEKENSTTLLKRSSILYDKLVLIPQVLDSPITKYELDSILKIAASSETIKNFNEFSSIFMLINEFGEKSVFDLFSSGNRDPFLLSDDSYKRFDKYVASYIKGKKPDKIKEHLSATDNRLYKSIITSKLLDDLNDLIFVSQNIKSTSGLFTQLHEDAILYTMDDSHPKLLNKIVNQIEQINYFDFGILSWDEIIELRESLFIQDFRRFVNEWFLPFKDFNYNLQDFEKRLSKFINDSKFSFIEDNLPNPKRTLLKGILSNIPLPIPFNPVSLADTINEIEKQFALEKNFSWLMFIQKTYSMNKNISNNQ